MADFSVRVELKRPLTLPEGQVLQSAPLEFQTDPEWAAVIVYVRNDEIEVLP